VSFRELTAATGPDSDEPVAIARTDRRVAAIATSDPACRGAVGRGVGGGAERAVTRILSQVPVADEFDALCFDEAADAGAEERIQFGFGPIDRGMRVKFGIPVWKDWKQPRDEFLRDASALEQAENE
jgi:hypothetical protein